MQLMADRNWDLHVFLNVCTILQEDESARKQGVVDVIMSLAADFFGLVVQDLTGNTSSVSYTTFT